MYYQFDTWCDKYIKRCSQMDISFHKLYLYDNVRQLLAIGDTFCTCKGDNGPMNSSLIKAHKGVDNKIVFRVLGPDRVPLSIPPNQQVYARLMDPDNRKVVLEKLCRTGPAKGIITLELDSGDIATLHVGIYNFVMIRTEDFVVDIKDYYIQKPMYVDFDNNVTMQLEITEQAFKAPVESIIIREKDWTPDLRVPEQLQPQSSFYSPRIPGSRMLNHINSVHTFSTYTEDFTGMLEIWGTLEEAPSPYVSEGRWFKIYPSTMSQDIEFIGFTGTNAWTFSANFLWLKFRYIPSTDVLDSGKLSKLIVRT